MMIDHGLLNGMERPGFRAEPLDGDDVPAIELIEELDTGIDGHVGKTITVSRPASTVHARSRLPAQTTLAR